MSGPPEGDAQERQRAAQRQGTAYRGATEAFIAILICMGLGYWADHRFDSSPTYLLIGTGLGFGAFVLRMVRLARQMAKQTEHDAGPPTKNLR